MSYQSINPCDGVVSASFEEIDEQHLESAVDLASSCFETWREMTFGDRALIVARAAAILRTRVEEFAQLATVEMGKLIGESRGEVQLSADILDYYATNAERFLKIGPTNRPTEITGIEIIQIAQGQVVRRWGGMRHIGAP